LVWSLFQAAAVFVKTPDVALLGGSSSRVNAPEIAGGWLSVPERLVAAATRLFAEKASRARRCSRPPKTSTT